MTTNLPAFQLRLSELVDEYDKKHKAIPEEIAAYHAACDKLKAAAMLGIEYGGHIPLETAYESNIERCLLKSAWRRVYNGLNIERIASAADKQQFERSMESPAPFTLENIRATFGKYIKDPRGNILRGLAEVFCGLDPAYKSHEKVKIGVKGLPKRVILSNIGSYGWGREKIEDVINALAAYQGKALVSFSDISDLLKDGECMLKSRGFRLVRYQNGNGHLFFEPNELRDINMALAEYYGEVLADAYTEKPDEKLPSTAVCKDLQFYPTPFEVIDGVLHNMWFNPDVPTRVLEPSCGDGRFMVAIRAAGLKVSVDGVEVDAGRVQACRAKGLSVVWANFLELVPTPVYDRVIMNPPFYGKHYVKHVEHALKFLKPGGELTAILPATARYDHGVLKGKWSDLPVGSFTESGTNINTTVLSIRKEK